MRYIRSPYDFATGGNYAAGAFDWSAKPRIVVPSTAVLTAGFTPDTPVPPETLNYLENAKADALALQCHSALQTWRISALMTTAGGGNAGSLGSILGMRVGYAGFAAGDTMKRPVQISYHPSTGFTAQSQSCDGSLWDPKTDTATSYTPATSLRACPGALNELFLFGRNTTFLYSVDAGNTWTTRATTGDTICDMHYMRFGGVDKYFKYTTGGGIWVYSGAMSSAPTASTVPGGTVGSDGPNGAFADNGAVLVVCTQQNHTYSIVSRSTDGGATFTNVLTFAGTNIADLTYNEFWGLFVIMTPDGNVYTSADGAAWVTLVAGSTAALGFSYGPGKLSSAGPAIVKVWSAVLSGSKILEGVAYSFNLGQDWNICPFGAPTSTAQIQSIRGFNNRIYATGLDYVWTSGQLGSPDSEL
jgi:hypothetical protein